MPGRPAVFLDRDGTLIEDRHYLADPAGVALLPGAAAAVRRLNRAGYAAVLVTNQSGIGRGLFTAEAYGRVHARLMEALAAEGARLDGAYHCPLAPDAPDPAQMRKPGSGMFRRAIADLGLDPTRSVLIGDRWRDVAAARVLGARAALVRSPQTERVHGVPLFEALPAAVEWILGGGLRDG